MKNDIQYAYVTRSEPGGMEQGVRGRRIHVHCPFCAKEHTHNDDVGARGLIAVGKGSHCGEGDQYDIVDHTPLSDWETKIIRVRGRKALDRKS